MTWPLPYPQIDPVLIAIGPLAIRWYALSYIAGIVLAWLLLRRTIAATPAVGTPEQADEFMTWATLGVVLGGRIGYVLFYELFFQTDRLFSSPLHIFAIWQGGMSFHGGMLGVLLATYLFTRRQKMPLWAFGDRLVPGVPFGLFFGRLANFINAELYGRQAGPDVPWAMVFPTDPLQIPRHPSQLYQAFLEGICLLAILLPLSRSEKIRARTGTLTGVFFIGYAIARIVGEMFRQPDAFLGFLFAGITMGQLLSVPMALFGAWLIWRAPRPKPA
jgi:phosphatidylglycerol---prolipoprotein diacylglyceryl transferase